MSPQRAAVRQKGRAEEKTSSFFLFLLVQEKRAFQKPLISLPDTKVKRKKRKIFLGGIKTRNQNSFSSNTNSNTSNGSEKNKVLFFLYMSFWLLGS